MTETTKIVQALCYFLERMNRVDKLRLVKLLFLADKYHLIRYGRTITNDEYWAMDYGPVGTVTKDILTLDPCFLDKAELAYAEKSLKKIDEFTFEIGVTCGTEALSETDIEALDFILDHFGKMKKRDLIQYTHQYPEWKQHEQHFKDKTGRRVKIETSELLSTTKNDCLAMPPDHMESSLEILMGLHD